MKNLAKTSKRAAPPSADEWFSGGIRAVYDREEKTLDLCAPQNAEGVRVFVRSEGSETGHTTFLGGFPDGSYGWARVCAHLPPEKRMAKLFLDYVGHGDSDKPKHYPYSTFERADLVEAAWRALDVKETTVVAFDYSSLVIMEILSRRLPAERGRGLPRINGVFIFNGGLFTDSHSHPLMTTPLLRTPMGRMGTWMAQRSRLVFGQMAASLWSKTYGVEGAEIDELFKVVTRRDGAAILHFAAGFVAEHKTRGRHLDFEKIFLAYKDEMPFLVGGSTEDPFEPRQVDKAERLLEKHGLRIARLHGGHLTTSEHPEQLARLIGEFWNHAYGADAAQARSMHL